MRRLLTILTLTMLMPLCLVAQKTNITFATTSNYLGNVPEREGEIKSVFEFTNSGNAPLIIDEIRTGCDCTTCEWEKESIAPGESGKITVIFDPEGLPGKFIKSIAIFANTTPSVSTLTIRGYVIPQKSGPFSGFPTKMGDIRLSSDSMNMDIVNRGIIRHKEINVINSSKEIVELAAYTDSKNMEITITPSQLKPLEKGKIALKWIVTDKEPLGDMYQEITISQNGKESGKIYASAEVHENFSMYKDNNYATAPLIAIDSNEFDMGAVVANSINTHNLIIRNKGVNELHIRKIDCDDNNISFSIKKGIKGGKSRKMAININANSEPSLRCAEIKFYTNDPQNPVITYTLFYEIVS